MMAWDRCLLHEGTISNLHNSSHISSFFKSHFIRGGVRSVLDWIAYVLRTNHHIFFCARGRDDRSANFMFVRASVQTHGM